MNLRQIIVRPVQRSEEDGYREMMQAHHYLGALPKIGETLWYIALLEEQWVALISFSSPALKCAVRDQWIGWGFRHQYDRLHLVTNNSRFLILPDWHFQNLGSRVLALCEKRLPGDWQERFGHPLLLMETFVDPLRFTGTVYKSANWLFVGHSKGFRRTRQGYSPALSPKMVFVRALRTNTQKWLSQPVLPKLYYHGERKMMLTASQMESLPDCFNGIVDPRRSQGRRHSLSTILSIAAGATLCGMRGYKAMSDWAKRLGAKARERFRCRIDKGNRVVPSEYVIRNLLTRVNPDDLDRALHKWNTVHGKQDETLAIDGKTMCNAMDAEGRQTHIMSAIGHETKICYAQKK